jgi:hypothetical protein
MSLSPDLFPILAFPESEVPRGTVIPPGVVVRRCAGCGARVMVSPSSLKLLATGRCQLACAACLNTEERINLGVMTPRALAELDAWSNPRRN